MCLLRGSQPRVLSPCVCSSVKTKRLLSIPYSDSGKAAGPPVPIINLISSSERFQGIRETWNPKTLKGISEKKYILSRLAIEVIILIFFTLVKVLHYVREVVGVGEGEWCLVIL